jgi:alcohol dehydrogenase
VRANAEDQDTAVLYKTLGAGSIDHLVARLDGLLNLAGIPRSLAECNVKEAAISTMAAEAAQQWTAAYNPRTLTAADFARLYESAFQTRGAGAA